MQRLPVIECNIPSCSAILCAALADAARAGWREMRETTSPEPDDRYGRKRTGRTHLGFCGACAKRFGVGVGEGEGR